jgi:integrase/recombinase XerD
MKTLNQEFTNWLQTLGFAKSTVKSFPVYTKELIDYLEQHKTTKIQEITTEQIHSFFFYWKNRKNKTRGGGLSQNHINKGITAIQNFVRFLNETKNQNLDITLEREQVNQQLPNVLTKHEINQLYQATEHLNKRNNPKAYQLRDKAMLVIFYGCGLRLNEGVSLQITDIQEDRKLIHVKTGKGNKERYVPISERNMIDLQEYIKHSRPWFLGDNLLEEAFFINQKGKAMQSFDKRLKLLKEETNITKTFSLHTLRHSIATHLLEGGMEIEHIKQFLGHSSLESTQIYTHIINVSMY